MTEVSPSLKNMLEIFINELSYCYLLYDNPGRLKVVDSLKLWVHKFSFAHCGLTRLRNLHGLVALPKTTDQNSSVDNKVRTYPSCRWLPRALLHRNNMNTSAPAWYMPSLLVLICVLLQFVELEKQKDGRLRPFKIQCIKNIDINKKYC